MKLFSRLKSWETRLERGPKIKIVLWFVVIFVFSLGVGFLTSLEMNWINAEKRQRIAYEEVQRMQSLIDALKQERYEID